MSSPTSRADGLVADLERHMGHDASPTTPSRSRSVYAADTLKRCRWEPSRRWFRGRQWPSLSTCPRLTLDQPIAAETRRRACAVPEGRCVDSPAAVLAEAGPWARNPPNVGVVYMAIVTALEVHVVGGGSDRDDRCAGRGDEVDAATPVTDTPAVDHGGAGVEGRGVIPPRPGIAHVHLAPRALSNT